MVEEALGTAGNLDLTLVAWVGCFAILISLYLMSRRADKVRKEYAARRKALSAESTERREEYTELSDAESEAYRKRYDKYCERLDDEHKDYMARLDTDGARREGQSLDEHSATWDRISAAHDARVGWIQSERDACTERHEEYMERLRAGYEAYRRRNDKAWERLSYERVMRT